MDWGGIAGLALAFAGILVSYGLDGGHVLSLLQPEAFAIVFGGTVGAVITQTRLPVFLRGVKMARWIVEPPADNRRQMSADIVRWSHNVRREGLLSLEPFMKSARDPFVAKGLRMIIDGIEMEQLRQILDAEIGAFDLQQRTAAKIWESAGGYSPTIGILGAVLGLIRIMEHLSDPTRLGGGIAVAFVATVYGVGFANLVYLPIANRLKAVILQQIRQRELVMEGLMAIAQGDHPRIIEDRLAAYLE